MIFGCGPKENFTIPKDKKLDVQWLDTFVYKSNLKNFDTLFVSDYLNYFEFQAGPNAFYEQNYENLIVAFSQKKANLNIPFIKYYQAMGSDGEFYLKIVLSEIIFMKYNREYGSKAIGNSIYSNVYEYSSDTIISTLYFSLNKGILGYKTTDGEFFEYYKKIKHK